MVGFLGFIMGTDIDYWIAFEPYNLGGSDSEIGFISEMYQSGATAVGIVNLGFIDANCCKIYLQSNKYWGIVAKEPIAMPIVQAL